MAKQSSEDRYGFTNVPCSDGQSLVIARIDGGGLLDQWNRKLQGFPTHQVALGDRIISVNSVSGDMEKMRNELRCDSVNMRVLKDLQRFLVHLKQFSKCSVT